MTDLERLKAEMEAAVHAARAADARARYLGATTAAIDEREATVRAAWYTSARYYAALAAQPKEPTDEKCF